MFFKANFQCQKIIEISDVSDVSLFIQKYQCTVMFLVINIFLVHSSLEKFLTTCFKVSESQVKKVFCS